MQLPVWSPTGDTGPGWMQSAAHSADRRYSSLYVMGCKHALVRMSHPVIPFVTLQVSVLCRLFNESRLDQQSKDVLGEITEYNKRYSGAPRRVSAFVLQSKLPDNGWHCVAQPEMGFLFTLKNIHAQMPVNLFWKMPPGQNLHKHSHQLPQLLFFSGSVCLFFKVNIKFTKQKYICWFVGGKYTWRHMI